MFRRMLMCVRKFINAVAKLKFNYSYGKNITGLAKTLLEIVEFIQYYMLCFNNCVFRVQLEPYIRI